MRGIVAWLFEEGFAKASEAEMGLRVPGPPELQCDLRRVPGLDRDLIERVVTVYNDMTWEVGPGVANTLDEDKGGLLRGHYVAVLTGNAGGLALPLWTSHVVLNAKPQ